MQIFTLHTEENLDTSICLDLNFEGNENVGTHEKSKRTEKLRVSLSSQLVDFALANSKVSAPAQL